MNVSPLLLLLVLAPLARAEAPPTRDPVAEIDGMLTHQRSESRGCNKFRKKWHGVVVKGGLNADSPSHVSKEQGMDALKLLEKYPGRTTSSARLFQYFVDHRDELARAADAKSVAARLARIEPQCEIFSHFTHMTLLQKDVAAFRFGKKEKGRVQQVVKRHLRDENTDATMTGLALKGKLFVTYLNTLYDGESPEALRKKALDWMAELETARTPRTDPPNPRPSGADTAPSAPAALPELNAWKQLEASYRGLLQEAGIVRAL